MNEKSIKNKKGFTLIESLVSIAIFIVLIGVVYQTSVSIIQQTRKYRESTTISGLADQYLELARNLPYSQVGTLTGNPHGNLPDQPNAATTTINNNVYSIYYEVTYIDDPADGTALLGTDTAPDDYKQIKLSIKNNTTGVITDFLTNAAPKSLESLSSGGVLYIKVFDAVGQPVAGASISIINNSVTPHINLSRTSDSSGNWVEVGLPNSVSSYHVIVTKSGYSSDQTYPSSGSNPNPTKPDSTISNGQVTQVSFAIDKLSNLTFDTVNQTCDPIANVGLEVKGSKLIGTPGILKFDSSSTSNTLGMDALNNIEWDNYTPSLTGSTYMIYGSSPIQQINVLPNTNQIFTLVLGPKTTNSLLVIVKDAATGNPIKGASVDLHAASPSNDTIEFTGGSIWGQQDWTGGAGQSDLTNNTMYYQDDGNINVHGTPSGVRLASGGGSTYVSSGTLTSSSFDTGASSTAYTTLNWQPTSQNASTSLKFQIATNNDDATWNFLGPDGTSNTYYTVPGSTITSTTTSEYVRYKAFLSTTKSSQTPILTSTSVNYVSGCFTPGQVIFPSLSAASNYQVSVSMAGYQTKTVTNITISGYNVLQVQLTSN